MKKILEGMLIALITIIVVFVLLSIVYAIGGLIFWGIGSFVIWAFGIKFIFTFWHGLAIAFIIETLAMIFGGKK